jgi:hypothetical protein
MHIHTVSFDDFSCSEFYLFGIHSTLENYRLAYLINSYLEIQLKRCNFDIDLKRNNQEANYPLYEFVDEFTENAWFLISNVYKTNISEENFGLFSENETRIHLLPERKKVDYILKLEGDFQPDFLQRTNEVIAKIPQVITSYPIDTNTLKSKEYLIF